MTLSIVSIRCLENVMITKIDCKCTLIIAFPITVAPKNVQKGTEKCPQVIPARSKRGFGI
jgi:hypothetical protein